MCGSVEQLTAVTGAFHTAWQAPQDGDGRRTHRLILLNGDGRVANPSRLPGLRSFAHDPTHVDDQAPKPAFSMPCIHGGAGPPPHDPAATDRAVLKGTSIRRNPAPPPGGAFVVAAS